MGAVILYLFIILVVIVFAVFSGLQTIIILLLFIHLLGSAITLPLAIYSEYEYKDRNRYRPLKHSLLYSWLYIYVFIKSRRKSRRKSKKK